MRIKLLLLASVFMISGTLWSQKKKYSKEEVAELKEYHLYEGFVSPSKKKTSTLVMKNGEEIKGNINRLKGRFSLIESLVFTKEGETQSMEIDVKDIKEAYVFGNDFEKFGKLNAKVNSAGTRKQVAKRKDTEDGQEYFVNKSLKIKNKKAENQYLVQLVNPDFDDYIAVYNDPLANESSGVGVGGVKLGGGVLISYYVEKNDKVIWLSKKNLKEYYEFLFGDNEKFMEMYPLNSIHWDWISSLILKYTEMQREN